ncbi:hypothetical protein NUU61_008446 [Penicillium alfredii]|uniref:endo-1,3(4)-beta-glucanase n=1 Tax=Penicillium alfredii TaxID=1506179 RepID=A0A9W9JWQ6_9EURO|nr:uncharacterized protein NUU61_008446 [Penicillium alfredii]KAJ5083867.1 hypothetical protein NUU61_008446 [Penicillium alfredii]
MSSPLSLSAGSLALSLLASSAAAHPSLARSTSKADYELVETWQGDHFLDYFNFHTGSDPTNGYVNYLDRHSAESAGLFKVKESGSVYLGVDHNTTLTPSGKGRDSVRIGSKKYYDKSLVVADIAHMPGAACGSWPAFWSVGKEWPGDGEIDIIEGVNLHDHNEIVMHTSGTCKIEDKGMSGTVNATGCGEDLGPVGCVIKGDKGSYGNSFNRQGGGVYAMQWTDEFLKIWFFPRRSIPKSLSTGKPDVTEFGTPMALVQDSCDVANSFKPQSFTFDVTFCGDWAGGVFHESGCPMSGSDSFQSCINHVAKNPGDFEQSYWEINSVKIYQTGVKDNGSGTPGPHRSATHEATETAVETHASEAPSSVHSVASISSQETPSATLTDLPVSSHSSPAPNPVISTSEAPVQDTTTEHSHPISAESLPVKSTKTRYVTNYVTSTKTMCSVSQSLAYAVDAPTISTSDPPPRVTEQPASDKMAPSAAPDVPTDPSSSQGSAVSVEQPKPATHVDQTVAAPAVTPNAHKTNGDPTEMDASADAVSQGPPKGNDAESVADTPAVNQVLSSAAAGASSSVPGTVAPDSPRLPSLMASQASKPLIHPPTGSATPSRSHTPSTSPSGTSSVFTGGASKLSGSFLAILAAICAELMA